MRELNSSLVLNLGPDRTNPRNSEGAFARCEDGSILFAYSRYLGKDWNDHQPCNIAVVRSYDEGNTWTEPEEIVQASIFNTSNVMSVSSVKQDDGRIGFYFIIKKFEDSSAIDGRFDNDTAVGSSVYTSLGRALTADGINFEIEECTLKAKTGYYIFLNDKLVRLSDGRLAFPASPMVENAECEVAMFVSDDDGLTFEETGERVRKPHYFRSNRGLQEPGLIEHNDGSIRIWARTDMGYQYEWYSYDGLKTCTQPVPSEFTSPLAPMSMNRSPDGTIYTVYNPVPAFNGRCETYSHVTIQGRNPIIVRKSTDDGNTWGACYVIEKDETDKSRGFCYSSMFFTNDESMLVAYCRGGTDDICGLNRLGIRKIALNNIE